MPFYGFAFTLVIYLALSLLSEPKFGRKIIGFFAAASISCYYWYRIPALLGFGISGQDGLLINLKNVLPGWSIGAITVSTTIFFFYWLAIHKKNKQNWLIRPQFFHKKGKYPYKLSA
jgi:hypothetical protein